MKGFASHFDMTEANSRFDMTDDLRFDMTTLSFRNEGFLTLLLTIKMTVVYRHKQERDTASFRTENHIQKSSLFDLETRVVSKRQTRSKSSQNFIISKREPGL